MADTTFYLYTFSQFSGAAATPLKDAAATTVDFLGGKALTVSGAPTAITVTDDDTAISGLPDSSGQTVTSTGGLSTLTVGQKIEVANSLTLTAGGTTYTIYRLDDGNNTLEGVVIPKALATWLTANPGGTMTVNSLSADNGGNAVYSDLAAPLPLDGLVEGTSGADNIGAGYTDADGDKIDGSDNTGAGVTAGGVAGSNDDLVQGFGGNDTIAAGAGNDTVYAGDGADSVMGDAGNDKLFGYGDSASGPDDGAADTLSGGLGNDTIDGGAGNDSLAGDDGNDSIIGGLGNDSITGGDGNDTVDGGDGDDSISGGAGDDSVLGGIGNDVIDGGLGADYVSGGEGDDSLSAGVAGDATPDTGPNTLDGGAGNDQLNGAAGSDVLLGGDGDDVIQGLLGADSIEGGAGNDYLLGDGGADDGGNNSDTINGGAGDDLISGELGDDLVDGGDGNDKIVATAGSDTITGGEGNDTLMLYPVGAGLGTTTFTDFNSGTGQNITDGDQTNNDFVDLSGYYNDDTLADYNAANGTTYATPLEWMRADQADGVLSGFDNALDLHLMNGGTAVDGKGLTFDNTNVVCFTPGTMIGAEHGPVAIETLVVGDLVQTRDRGLQPIRWIGTRHLSTAELALAPQLRPVRIRAGALGGNVPAADLVVSPWHRMLVNSALVHSLTGKTEVLVAARNLVDLDGVEVVEDAAEVTYIHFMCEQHEVVEANGAASETLNVGLHTARHLTPESYAEILKLFPQVLTMVQPPVRPPLAGDWGRNVVRRHIDAQVALAG